MRPKSKTATGQSQTKRNHTLNKVFLPYFIIKRFFFFRDVFDIFLGQIINYRKYRYFGLKGSTKKFPWNFVFIYRVSSGGPHNTVPHNLSHEDQTF